MTPVITGLIRPKPFGFVCPTPTIGGRRAFMPDTIPLVGLSIPKPWPGARPVLSGTGLNDLTGEGVSNESLI